MQTWTCTKCNTENDVGSRYCEKCGIDKKDNSKPKDFTSDNPYAKLTVSDIEIRIADSDQKCVGNILLGVVCMFMALIAVLFSKAVCGVLFCLSIACFLKSYFITRDKTALKNALNAIQQWERIQRDNDLIHDKYALKKAANIAQTLNVCKKCLKAGVSLQLNEDSLCSECECLEKDEISMNEVVNILASGNISKVIKYNEAVKMRDLTCDKNFDYIYKQLMKGKALEKQGKTDEALKIYIKNLRYLPPGTDYYTRPCIILEKKKDYSKAIEICDLAIKCIRENRFKADVEEFTKRRKRLEKKLGIELSPDVDHTK